MCIVSKKSTIKIIPSRLTNLFETDVGEMVNRTAVSIPCLNVFKSDKFSTTSVRHLHYLQCTELAPSLSLLALVCETRKLEGMEVLVVLELVFLARCGLADRRSTRRIFRHETL